MGESSVVPVDLQHRVDGGAQRDGDRRRFSFVKVQVSDTALWDDLVEGRLTTRSSHQSVTAVASQASTHFFSPCQRIKWLRQPRHLFQSRKV